ncbi:MAG: hypothetical protein L0Z70_15015, partial [Chloroflexi bacterium]|nr:hypothetical protein [Chloroflexota bacterium]
TLEDAKLSGSGRDDDWKDGALFILEAGGESPEGRFGRISGYDDSSGTLTLESSLGAAIESGDRYGLASGYYPIGTMIALANLALRGLGDLPLVDTTSLETAEQQSEYAAALAWKRRPPSRIDIQGQPDSANDNRWQTLYAWEYVPAAGGESGLLVFQQELPGGRSLRVWYEDAHPPVESYADEINELFAPALATAALVEKALMWQTSRLGGADDFLRQRWNDAKSHLERMRLQHPVWQPARHAKMRFAGIGGR